MLVKNFVYLDYFQLTIMFFSEELSKAADKWKKRHKWNERDVYVCVSACVKERNRKTDEQ